MGISTTIPERSQNHSTNVSMVGGKPHPDKNISPNQLYKINSILACLQFLIIHSKLSDQIILKPVRYWMGQFIKFIDI